MKEKLIKKFPIFIILIIVTLITQGVLFITTINYDYMIKNSIEKHTQDQMWNYIREEILDTGKLTKLNAKYIAKKIECALLRDFNLDELKKILESGELPPELHKTLSEAIKGNSLDYNSSLVNPSDKVLIRLLGKIIAIYEKSPDKIYALSLDNEKVLLDEYVSFEKYLLDYANIRMDLDEIENLLIKNYNKILMLIPGNSFGNIEGVIVTEENINIIRQIYETHGFDALKKVHIINVSHITQNSDIFGNADNTFLDKHKNFKFTVITSSSLYDNIKDILAVDVNAIKNNSLASINKIANDINKNCLLFLLQTVVLIALGLLLSSIYRKNNK